MPHKNPTCDEVVYRLILVVPRSCLVLASRKNPEPALPRISVSKWTRPASTIQRAIRETWGLRSIVIDFLEHPSGASPCAVACLLSSLLPEGLTPTTIDHLPLSELTESERLVTKAICADDPGERGAFSRLGWLDEAKKWICEAVGCEIQFAEEIEQLNAGGTYALLRFPTLGGPAYWLKATGEPNLREFMLTAALTAICPHYLPPLIAMRPDWNAWVMGEAGTPIEPKMEGRILGHVARSLADLQKKTRAYGEQLLAAGATDHRTKVLRSRIGGIVSYLEEAMEHQTSTKVARLAPSRLRHIGTILEAACDTIEELEIPETVIHNDVNCGNILVRGDQCVFTDWCEVCVGNPLLTFQHLLMLLRFDMDCAGATLSRMIQEYRHAWLDSLTPQQFDRAFALAPLLAIFSYLYGRGDWLRSQRRHDVGKQSYARALARHMDRAARIPSLMEALCS
jgi:hypothetical protein